MIVDKDITDYISSTIKTLEEQQLVIEKLAAAHESLTKSLSDKDLQIKSLTEQLKTVKLSSVKENNTKDRAFNVVEKLYDAGVIKKAFVNKTVDDISSGVINDSVLDLMEKLANTVLINSSGVVQGRIYKTNTQKRDKLASDEKSDVEIENENFLRQAGCLKIN